jgi:hypothetical protein
MGGEIVINATITGGMRIVAALKETEILSPEQNLAGGYGRV